MGDTQLLNTLENSSQVLLAPPNLVTEEQRHVAEQIFIALEKSALPVATCRELLETSKNDFVLFQAASLFRQGIVRDWVTLGMEVVDSAHSYILSYIIDHVSLAACVREQLVHTLVIIYKRRQIEPVTEKNVMLFSDIGRLVQSSDTFMQLVACSLLLALLNEFSSSSRMSSIGLTWELHSKCKMKFEQNDLKQVFIFCLQTLSDLLAKTSLDVQTSMVVERLLGILEQIFGWQFMSRVPKQMVSLTNGQASSFQPPMSWRDVILMEDITKVLFQLHLKVRNNDSLSNQSLQCLGQLASMNGSIFADEVAHRDFVQHFIWAFLEFASASELKTSECLGVASVVKSLMEFTPIWALLELPDELLSALFSCMTRLTCNFCRSAHLTADLNQSMDDESVFMEAFDKVLDAWMTFVNRASEFPAGVLCQSAVEIFGSYLQCHLSSTDKKNDSSEYEEEDEEDCLQFSDQLFAIGGFARLVPEYSIPLLNQLLQERISLLAEQLHRIQPNTGCSSMEQQRLDNINEDLHWLMLIATNVLTSREDGEISMIPELVIEYTVSDACPSFVSLVTDEVLATTQTNNNSMIVLISKLLHLAQLEIKAFQAGLVAYLSPQVSETLMGFLSRWASTYLLFDENLYSKMSPVLSSSFGSDTESSVWLVNFLLDKILANISALNSELGVVTKTMEALLMLVDRKNRCDVTVKCSAFWSMASNFSQNAFPFNVLPADAKKLFCQTLILASSANVSNEQRRTYVQMVLGSFSTSFKDLLKHPDLRSIFHSNEVKVEVQNALDCLCASAEAARANNAAVVFELMHPVLIDTVNILDLYHNYEEVVHLVLELFSIVTKQLGCYLSKTDCVRMYEACMVMMQTFAKHNQGRRMINKDVEEDQFNDLLSLIQMLNNILSKDFISFEQPDNSSSANGVNTDVADVALYGLNILIPLMTIELMKIPTLCSAYLSLLSYMAEIHIEQITRLSDQVFASLSAGVEFAVVTHGTEITRICLELISFFATYVSQEKSVQQSSSLYRFGNHFIKILFDLLLVETFDVELMEVASNALFSLLCCHQQTYCELVNELLRKHSTSSYYERLLGAFNKLTPPGLEMKNSRQNRVKFMESFDQFLVNVRGFLCVR